MLLLKVTRTKVVTAIKLLDTSHSYAACDIDD